MKKVLSLLVLIISLSSCKEDIVKKPKNLIEKDQMVDIIYDFTLLEAIKYQSSNPLVAQKINSKEYIYKKYTIDSVQFVQSNMYYASDYKQYKKIYDQVNSRLDEYKLSTEALIDKENKSKSKSKKVLKQ